MDDHGGQDDLTAAMALMQQQMQQMQQQMQQMQQTINTQEAARKAAAELYAQKAEQQGAPIGERAFALIENMVSSSLNKNKETDRSKTVNSIDDLAAKVDQLIKGKQSQVFIME
ncbi:hypothetical protein DY000_02014962 [Brassica cretica]|uniref:Uncharacterized protein n=1 Tax=Brassica cretica TaxID=69181 RepID=A0ABQ7CWJ4_BRACR|nr:hypothetical protein DY000_02014962 [Brassica cretica]